MVSIVKTLFKNLEISALIEKYLHFLSCLLNSWKKKKQKQKYKNKLSNTLRIKL